MHCHLLTGHLGGSRMASHRLFRNPSDRAGFSPSGPKEIVSKAWKHFLSTPVASWPGTAPGNTSAGPEQPWPQVLRTFLSPVTSADSGDTAFLSQHRGREAPLWFNHALSQAWC